jgi:hypothetical protein
MSELHGIASAVIRRAERQGYVVPRDIRGELARAGLPETDWKAVVTLARESLSCRKGRYYYINPLGFRQPAQEKHQAIDEAIRRLIQEYQAKATDSDRRQEDRLNVIQPVKVLTEDGRELQVLSRDLSPAGIRLVGTRSLLGQKIHVWLPRGAGQEPTELVVRILWTGAAGDGLFENGGMFLEMGS